ncbi:MAG: hypothetical protein JW717_13500 [Marinilabiliaceae bacterium]|nr:hypothetical protein [Marinilabiliaceae bacterium]
MNKIISIFVFTALLIFASACNQTNSQQNNQTKNQVKKISYLSVDDVFAKGESLSGKTIHVVGIIEHACKHTWKRFKIIGNNENQFIKIELGNKFPAVDASITGKQVKVTGKLISVKMDEKMVKEWENKMREGHKGEEGTLHFKEEITFIQNIQHQIANGEIPYYINYNIEADNYVLE